MFRIHLARISVLGFAVIAVGCNSCGSERPGLFSRFRTTSSTPTMVSQGDCCDRVVSGPYLPPMQPQTILPAPTPNNIPRIDENGKQMPWDGKMSTRPIGTKTGNETRNTKEGG